MYTIDRRHNPGGRIPGLFITRTKLVIKPHIL